MKRITMAICAAAFLFSCNSEEKKDDVKNGDTKTVSSTSESQAKTEEWVPVDSATAMKSMMEYGTPGQQQAILAKSDGNWKGETTMWMSPGAEPMKSTTSIANKMVMGGRYQMSTVKGDMMGMPFEGTSTTGYDNAKKVYVSNWIDNMGTGIMNMEGTWDDASKSISFKGKMLCPANGKECEMREVIKMIDDNTQLMEMYGPDMKTGKEYKNMEIKLTRNK